MTSSPIAVAGLILDIAGAVILAWAFMFKRSRQRVRETATAVGFNVTLDLSLAKQTEDARVGGSLLAGGFALQVAAAWGWRPDVALWIAACIAGAVAVVAVALLRAVLHPRAELNAIVVRLRESEPGSWQGIVDAYGRRLGRERREGETPAQLGERLVGERRWRRVVRGVELDERMLRY